MVLENFKVGGLAQYGLDYDSLKAVNPRLVLLDHRLRPGRAYAPRGYDFLIQGLGGLMSITGRPDGEEGGGPMKVGVALTDILTGLYATNAVLAALAWRERSGEGQHIDMALLDVQVACLANQAGNYLATGQSPEAAGQCAPQHRALPGFSDRRRLHDPRHRQRRAVRALLRGRRCAAARDRRTLRHQPRARGQSRHADPAAEEAHRRARHREWITKLEALAVPCGPINTWPTSSPTRRCRRAR